MVKMSLGNSGRFLNEEWHRKRRVAHEETYTIEEWSDIDITKYDLETVDFDRKFKDSTYITDARIETEGASEGGHDIRKFPTLE
jgi:hypothetical protein